MRNLCRDALHDAHDRPPPALLWRGTDAVPAARPGAGIGGAGGGLLPPPPGSAAGAHRTAAAAVLRWRRSAGTHAGGRASAGARRCAG
ncbi:MAG TPA: hypothetical protein DIV57_18305 [Stenotrophomonas sp.]|nr:hypothetical protein [Stenotrophomonas sp.]